MSNLKVMEKMCGNKIKSIGGNGLGFDITFEDGLVVLITRDSQGFIKLKEIGVDLNGTARKLSKSVEVSGSLGYFNKFINRFVG
jgi:hypothetical protein